jgi:4-diphosphocytidyl-2-C-methyl-D-erythritol kinase
MKRAAVARRVVVEARAKLNLGLAVGPARPDGFHDLVTVFQSVSLADTLVAERVARGFTLALRHEPAALLEQGAGHPAALVPAGAGNLVLRAARLVHERLGLPGGARFRLVKRIPAQAGMGGGSADAAAAIVAILSLHGVRLGRPERLALAAELGSDVPFAMLGGTALGTGRGERLRPLRLAESFRAVVAIPAWRVSTGTAFGRVDKAKYHLTRWGPTLRLAASLGRNRVTASCTGRLGNTFERALGPRRRDFESLCARLRAAGALQPHLTGSGSGVFGILPKGTRAREVAGRFTGNEALFAVRSVGSGLRLRTQP